MTTTAPIYRKAETAPPCRLYQGEFLSNLIRRVVVPATLGTDTIELQEVVYSFAVVMAQDCDLDQDFRARQGGNKPDKLIHDVLCCQVALAEQLRGGCGGSDIWKRIVQNKDERYQYLQRVEPSCDASGEEIPELGIDFKQHFTVPTDELYRLIDLGEAKRRCVLVSPYLEHLSNRFTHFLSRIPLPQEHLPPAPKPK